MIIVYRKQVFSYFFTFLVFGLVAFFSDAHATKKIETPHFSILFQENMTEEAQRVANTLETLHGPVAKTLGARPRPLRILLNNQTAYANGMFTSVPLRLEFYNFYSSDPHFVGNVDWLNALSIHEYRHYMQYSIQYQSTPIWLRSLYFGCNLFTFTGVPRFFSEGDAVVMETALSKSGRGRLPGWEKLYKMNLLEHKPTTFAQCLFRSYRRDLPDEYRLGYYFVTHIRNKYGAKAIEYIYKKSIRRVPYFGFYNAVKEVTKKSVMEVYKEMNQELLLGWSKQLDGLKITPATHLNIKQHADSSSYIRPFIDRSGHIFAWKKGISVRHQLVMLSPMPSTDNTSSLQEISNFLFKEKRLFFTVFTNALPSPFACAVGEGCAVWLEQYLHPWKGKIGDNNVHRIRLQYYDFKRKTKKTLVKNIRYNALAISPNGKQLVAIESGENGSNQLVVVELDSGRVIKKIKNHDGGFYMTPNWSDNEHVVVVKSKDQKNSILLVNVISEQVEMLLPFTHEHRNSPQIYKDYLLYNSSYNGIDNIYAMHLPTKACFQVTSRKYGAYLGMVDCKTNQLIFTDYTKNGMEIAVMAFDPLSWTPLENVEDRSFRYYDTVVAQEDNGDVLSQVPEQIYPVTDASFGKDSLAFTGMTLDTDARNKKFKTIPFEIVSLQGDFKASPYFFYQFNMDQKGNHSQFKQKQSELGLCFSYYTVYPILTARISARCYKEWTDSVRIIQTIDGPGAIPYIKALPKYWGSEFLLGIKLPYYFPLNNSSAQLSFATTAVVQPPDASGGMSYTQEYQLDIKNTTTSCTRNINPPWCQNLCLKMQHSVKSTKLNQTKFAYMPSLDLFFPGIVNHHYFMLCPKYHYKSSLSKIILDLFNAVSRDSSVRVDHYYHRRMSLFNIYTAYGLPIAYPDCGIPYILYLKHISLEGYYDFRREKVESEVKMGSKSFSDIDTNDTTIHNLGIKFIMLNHLLSLTNLSVKAILDFGLCKKKNDDWKFICGASFSLNN